VYIGTFSGKVDALDGRTGTLLSTAQVGGRSHSPVANGVVYVGDTDSSRKFYVERLFCPNLPKLAGGEQFRRRTRI
jgi:outer membrane protein assembly factor BamB